MLDDIIRDRKQKLDKYKGSFDPYPAKIKRDFFISDAFEEFSALEKSEKVFSVVGRILEWRDQGKILFGKIEDRSGRMQIVVNEKETEEFNLIKTTFDIGDFIEVSGKVFKTARGEKSILCDNAKIIAKSLRPLPTQWYGLEDTETRLRKRYLDLLLNQETREIFAKKSLFWKSVRDFLKKADFLEVETPVLENVPGGAEAEPFVTHHNALDADFYLRISLELPLKKLLVGGYEKVFEIGRIFRNEGIDKEHLQDYTQMECYWAYADYNDMAQFIEEMYKTTIKAVFGNLKTNFGKEKIDWGKKWPKIDYYKTFKTETGLDLKNAAIQDLKKKAQELKIEFGVNAGRGRLIDLIYKKTVRPKLIQPCFLVDPPIELEPLAKRLKEDLNRVQRFQIMAAGTELGKGFSELNDPLDQRKRFEEQMKLREAGDKEAQRLDEDFLEALEYGMPPAAGFGMSERLFAVLMDKPVRETVFFPLMRPKGD